MSDLIPYQRTIVVGVDGSSSSMDALRVAASLVPLAGDVINAVAVWQWPLVIGLYSPPNQDYEHLASTALDRAVVGAFPFGTPSTVVRTVTRGLPPEALLKESEGASLLIVGAHAHDPVAYLCDPVSAAVAERATCPVLICHGTLKLIAAQETALRHEGEASRRTTEKI